MSAFNPIAAFRPENLVGYQSRVIQDFIAMIATDQVCIIMSDRNMHCDDSEREVKVFSRGSNAQEVAFGSISNVPEWLKIWSGSCIIDNCYLEPRANKAVLTELIKRIKKIRDEKATLLLSELPRRANFVNEHKFSIDVPGPSLKDLLHEGTYISISNNYSAPPKKVDCPIFLDLNAAMACRLGIVGLKGFYNYKSDIAVITDGTFFVVSQGERRHFFNHQSTVSVFMRTPRYYLPGLWSSRSESSRKCLVNQCSGEVASMVHSALKASIKEQIRQVGESRYI